MWVWIDFILVLAFQIAAIFLSLPFFRFRLRPWLIGASLGVTLLLIASLLVPSELASFFQVAALLLGGAMIAAPRLMAALARRQKPGTAHVLVLRLPFRGRWLAAAAGPDPRLNHHLVASDQVYACDFVSVDVSLGKPILAPGNGEIISIVDGEPDRRPSPRADDPSVAGNPFGNYVVLRVENSYVVMCHLMCGSIRVAVEQQVVAGDLLAQCGNSGRSTGPHLHIHAQQTPEPAPFKAIGVPISFADAPGGVVITGDIVTGSL